MQQVVHTETWAVTVTAQESAIELKGLQLKPHYLKH